MFLFNNCLLVYFNGDPPTARPPPPPPPPLLPRGGLDGEEAGGGTSHSPLPPGTAAAAGPRAGGGRAGRAAARRGPGAATAPRRCRSASAGLLAPRPQGQWQPPRSQPAQRSRELLLGTRAGEKGECKNKVLRPRRERLWLWPFAVRPWRNPARRRDRSSQPSYGLQWPISTKTGKRGGGIQSYFLSLPPEKKKKKATRYENRVSCISLTGARGLRCRLSLDWRSEYMS